MAAQSRQTKVLITLLISIVVCTIILNTLGHNPPSAGAFCLSQYYRLVPVEKLIRSREVEYPGFWKWIEIYYGERGSDGLLLSGIDSGIEKLDSQSGISNQEDMDCHFIICNGRIGLDGQIKLTEKWKKQLPVTRTTDNNMRSAWQNEQTIYICIVTNSNTPQPTNFQIKRADVLVEELCREFNVKPESILYPNNGRY
jgi:hypothetical protein